jgi:hypothetical protein
LCSLGVQFRDQNKRGAREKGGRGGRKRWEVGGGMRARIVGGNGSLRETIDAMRKETEGETGTGAGTGAEAESVIGEQVIEVGVVIGVGGGMTGGGATGGGGLMTGRGGLMTEDAVAVASVGWLLYRAETILSIRIGVPPRMAVGIR